MKKLLFQFALSAVLIFLSNGFVYSANEYFRSVASGNWDSPSTWEMSVNNGSTWFPATSIPSDTSGVITVRSPNTVTITTSVNCRPACS